MRPPLRLTSLDNPRLKQVLHLRKHRDRRQSRQFIAEGYREISRALASNLRLQEMYWSPEISSLKFEQLLQRFPRIQKLTPLPSIFDLTPPLFRKIAYLENPEGILALFEQPIWSLDALPKTHSDLFLVASGIEKPGNLGAMARTALAAGATALLVADEEVDAFNPNAIRASTGAVFTLPIVSSSTKDLLTFLRARNTTIIAATPDAPADYYEVPLSGSMAIVIGAEDIGVSEQWRAASTMVRIPMACSIVDSLNASTAAAILLFEAVRQQNIARQ